MLFFNLCLHKFISHKLALEKAYTKIKLWGHFVKEFKVKNGISHTHTSFSLGIRNSLALGQGVGTHREIERHPDELLNARPTAVRHLASVSYLQRTVTPSTHEQCASVKFYI